MDGAKLDDAGRAQFRPPLSASACSAPRLVSTLTDRAVLGLALRSSR